ncbi:MAG: glycosyltransferase family 4 protein [Candidatus Nanoarchaeia archaeon]
MRKKLLVATDSFLPRWDGISRFLKEILPSLTDDYEVTVLAPKYPGRRYEFPRVKVVTFPLMNMHIGDYTPPRPELKLIKKHVKEADVVWGQTIGPIGAEAMFYARKYRKPLLAYIHSVEWELFSRSLKHFRKSTEFVVKRMAKWLYNRCDLLLVPSENTMDLLTNRGIKSKKMIIELGVDVKRFSPVEDKKEAKKKVGLKPDKIIIGYLGRFGREKDLKTLYQAFKSLQNEFDNIELLLVGGDRESLQEFIDSFDGINVVGSVEDPEHYYRAMDIYVLPSLTETTSLTTLEAMSTGVPVVCTSVGHIPNYILHRLNGYFFPTQNVTRLVLALKMLIKDEKLRERIGKKGRKTVVDAYSWEDTVEEISVALARFT